MAKDPYKYFRVEAPELLDGLTQGVIQLEKETAAPDLVARLLRLAHTLKGAARVVKQPGIAELVHTIEDLLASHREAQEPLPQAQGSELLRLLDTITSQVKALDHASTANTAPAATTTITTHSAASTPPGAVIEEPLETLRVDVQEMDVLLRRITEAEVQLGTVRKALGTVDSLRDMTGLLLEQLTTRPRGNGAGLSSALLNARGITDEIRSNLDRFQRTLTVDVERVDAELAEIRDVAHRLRLIPAHTVFPSLDRAVRDAAHELEQRVDFAVSGGDVRLDANILSLLRDALAHVVRNAVTHGVETELERTSAGKSLTKHVRLHVERRGGRVAFVCKDDGRGINVEAVRHAAVIRGLISASSAKSLPPDKVIDLLCTTGLSTSGEVTELSGRGIGLDVVRATIARLKGEMNIYSEPGLGATVEMVVPVSIASLQGLVVEAAGTRATIPLDAVRQTLRVHDTDIARSADGDSILYDGTVIPFLSLSRILRRSTAMTRGHRIQSAVIVQARNRTVAIGVDRLMGTSNIVIWSPPEVIDADPIVLGASLDAEGNPQLVLDPHGLAAIAHEELSVVREDVLPKKAPILVIDDSLTTRMLEQSILESAGYAVDLAVSAEDALIKASDRKYGLFIVDVEMPGMDGFQFVAHTRSDSVLRDIPAILVTSRNAVEDRRRGEHVGASAYIVKSEFDQVQLLRTIRGLIG